MKIAGGHWKCRDTYGLLEIEGKVEGEEKRSSDHFQNTPNSAGCSFSRSLPLCVYLGVCAFSENRMVGRISILVQLAEESLPCVQGLEAGEQPLAKVVQHHYLKL